MSVELQINAGRLLYGLSRIGYTTSSAICDIIDNSVRAGAKDVRLIITKEREDYSDSRKNNVKEYLIIDDGTGMDKEGICRALVLGATDEFYEDNSLSKFGLGLKSAAFSQGDKLEIVSSNGDGAFSKFCVSLPNVMESGTYSAEEEDLNGEDLSLIEKYLVDNRGTIVRVCQIRKNNHPSVAKTVSELNVKLGVIYFYFLNDESTNIHIGENQISAVDPLFTEEAESNGNLNENEWEGTDVRWIEKPFDLTLDDELGISVQIEVTQLPYPPIFKITSLGESKDVEVRKKYLIGASNYGFYVYRNNRLISWASRLNGIIPYDQDYYAFRGRIIIDDSADDFFNIDVKKSTLTLSDEAWNAISDATKMAKNKSKQAWKSAGRFRKEIINKDPNEIANKLMEEFEQIELLPGDQEPSEEQAKGRINQIIGDMTEKIKVIVRMMREDSDQEPSGEEATEEEIEQAIKGSSNIEISKIFRVSSVPDNLLWEPYYDADLKNCVRINKLHRFARFIYEDNSENEDMQVVFDLLMLQLADAEYYAYRNVPDYDYEELKKILSEYRRITSEFLANMCRRLEDKLPPNYSQDEV